MSASAVLQSSICGVKACISLLCLVSQSSKPAPTHFASSRDDNARKWGLGSISAFQSPRHFLQKPYHTWILHPMDHKAGKPLQVCFSTAVRCKCITIFSHLWSCRKSIVGALDSGGTRRPPLLAFRMGRNETVRSLRPADLAEPCSMRCTRRFDSWCCRSATPIADSVGVCLVQDALMIPVGITFKIESLVAINGLVYNPILARLEDYFLRMIHLRLLENDLEKFNYWVKFAPSI